MNPSTLPESPFHPLLGDRHRAVDQDTRSMQRQIEALQNQQRRRNGGSHMLLTSCQPWACTPARTPKRAKMHERMGGAKTDAQINHRFLSCCSNGISPSLLLAMARPPRKGEARHAAGGREMPRPRFSCRMSMAMMFISLVTWFVLAAREKKKRGTRHQRSIHVSDLAR